MFPLEVIFDSVVVRNAIVRKKLIATLRAAGAVAPGSARSLVELHVEPSDAWRRLVTEGRVREGSPDHFYLFEANRSSRRGRIVKMIMLCVLVVGIPAVLFFVNAK